MIEIKLIIPAKIQRELETVSPEYINFHKARIESNLNPKHAQKAERDMDSFISMLPSSLSEVDKATLLYDILRYSIHYDYQDSQIRYTYLAAFYRKKAVCMGIAELYMRLCRRWGLECNVVIGFAGASGRGGGGLHAWNQLRLCLEDGEPRWYHCDPTWDLTENKLIPTRRYFLKSDQYMYLHDHYWTSTDYPSCYQSAIIQPILPRKGVDLGCRILKRVTH